MNKYIRTIKNADNNYLYLSAKGEKFYTFTDNKKINVYEGDKITNQITTNGSIVLDFYYNNKHYVASRRCEIYELIDNRLLIFKAKFNVYISSAIIYNGFIWISNMDGSLTIIDKDFNKIKELRPIDECTPKTDSYVNTNIPSMIVFNDLIYVVVNKSNLIVYDKQFNCVNKLIQFESSIYCVVVYDNLLYTGEYGQGIKTWDSKCLLVNQLTLGTSIFDMKVHNDLLYASSPKSVYILNSKQQIIYCFKDTNTYEKMFVYKDALYCVNRIDFSLDVFSEYYPHHYINLPKEQKDKIKNWRKIFKPAQIHKDISLLFQRELLL